MASLDGVPRVCIAGSRGVFLDAAGPRFSEPVQYRILALARAVGQLPGVQELVPGMNNVLVVYDPRQVSPTVLCDQLMALWEQATVDETPGRDIDIPVIYSTNAGDDLVQIAALAQLDVDEFIRLHSEAVYQVACVGAMPGFPYLSGLDPRLATPRRAVPRMRLEQGAVIIGGAQAGIMPCSAPSGWHVIGRTDLQLFDAQQTSPSFLQPGDRIRFSIAGVES